MVTSLAVTAFTIAVVVPEALSITAANMKNANAVTVKSKYVLPVTVLVKWDSAMLAGFAIAAGLGLMLLVVAMAKIWRTPHENMPQLRDSLAIRVALAVVASVFLGLFFGAISLILAQRWVLLTLTTFGLAGISVTVNAFGRGSTGSWRHRGTWISGTVFLVIWFLGVEPLLNGSGALLNSLERLVIM
jgi:hypothetical protein